MIYITCEGCQEKVGVNSKQCGKCGGTTFILKDGSIVDKFNTTTKSSIRKEDVEKVVSLTLEVLFSTGPRKPSSSKPTPEDYLNVGDDIKKKSKLDKLVQQWNEFEVSKGNDPERKRIVKLIDGLITDEHKRRIKTR